MVGGKGSCACGQTNYSFSGDPVGTALCHCLNCKHITGSAFASVLLVPSSNFSFEDGAPTKSVTLQHHVEGMDMTPVFCGKCGSVLCKTADDDRFRGLHIVFAGTVDDAEVAAPQMELWTKYRLDWVKPLDGVKQCAAFE